MLCFAEGEIFIYDIRQTDPFVASILDKNDVHNDEITVLKWIKDPKSNKKKFYVCICFLIFSIAETAIPLKT